jgi:hypothetical protein
MVVQTHDFLISALVGGEWSGSRPGRFTVGEVLSDTRWREGWVSHRTDPDKREKKKIVDPSGTRTPIPLSPSL